MKFSMAIEKKNRANIGTVEGLTPVPIRQPANCQNRAGLRPRVITRSWLLMLFCSKNRRVWPSGRMQFWPWNWSFRWEIRPIGESFLLLNTPRQA